ncbi:WhiB family transcriptional regulator [Streptomyces sp. NBC_00353]|uniref:WhiB family transcriptional regulator n=1 Tax=Streptomyces sp. NBC_00353 TaxID=2975722 RepID=UPI002E261E89
MPRTPKYLERLRPLSRLWDWQHFAACSGMDSSVLFSPSGERGRRRREREERARRVCDTCVVWQECARMALDTREQYGVWGGLSEADRVRML